MSDFTADDIERSKLQLQLIALLSIQIDLISDNANFHKISNLQSIENDLLARLSDLSKCTNSNNIINAISTNVSELLKKRHYIVEKALSVNKKILDLCVAELKGEEVTYGKFKTKSSPVLVNKRI